MTQRLPLVRANGRTQELPSGDTISGGTKFTASPSPPSSPSDKDSWLNTRTGRLLTWFAIPFTTGGVDPSAWFELGPGDEDIMDLFKCLTADDTGGQNVNTAQPWFPTAGGVLVEAATTYFMFGRLWMTRAAGTTSHTTSLLWGGTATLTDINYWAEARTGDSNALAATNGIRITAATATAVKAASTSATEDVDVFVNGVIRINAAGTLIPQFQYSAAPGGAPTIKKGSHLLLFPMGDNTVGNVGQWS